MTLSQVRLGGGADQAGVVLAAVLAEGDEDGSVGQLLLVLVPGLGGGQEVEDRPGPPGWSARCPGEGGPA